MKTVTCDQCGSVNARHANVCELCGESLADARRRLEKRQLVTLVPAMLLVTGAIIVVPGILLHVVIGAIAARSESMLDGGTLYWGVYSAVWVLALIFSPKYEGGLKLRYRRGPDRSLESSGWVSAWSQSHPTHVWHHAPAPSHVRAQRLG